MSKKEYEALDAAKKALIKEYDKCAWVRAVGIAPAPSGGLGLRLNVDPDLLPAGQSLPEEYAGLPVETVFIKGYEARPSKD